MNAEDFEDIGYYFKQSLHLIVYAYLQIKRDKSQHPYSRRSIHENTKRIRHSSESLNEIENYLRNDMVNNYLKESKKLFKLDYFTIQPGAEESKQNIGIGIADIKFECASAVSMSGTAFLFECKRLNKYAGPQQAYIKDGMMRFVSRQYYAESRMTLAGMIAFVEADLEKKPNGRLPVDQVADLLRQNIDDQNDTLKTTVKLSPHKLTHRTYSEVSDFKYSYLSKHIRSEDNREITIHHLLLDYYEILVP